MSEFIEYIADLLRPLGSVSARAMFGGYGIYHGDVMFAIVMADTLYFKTTDANRADFDACGLRPFIYARGRKRIVLSFYQAPPEAMDNSDEMCRWARKAYEAAAAVPAKHKRRKSSAWNLKRPG